MQGVGGFAILLRSVVLQQLLAQKQRGSRPVGLGDSHPRSRNAKETAATIMRDAMAAQANAGRRVCSALGPLLSPLYVQRAIQVYPKVFVSPKGELRSPSAVLHILRGASALAANPSTAAVAGHDRQSSRANARSADVSSGRVWDGGGRGSGSSGMSSMYRAVLRSAAMTSIDKHSLPKSDLSRSFVQSALHRVVILCLLYHTHTSCSCHGDENSIVHAWSAAQELLE